MNEFAVPPHAAVIRPLVGAPAVAGVVRPPGELERKGNFPTERLRFTLAALVTKASNSTPGIFTGAPSFRRTRGLSRED